MTDFQLEWFDVAAALLQGYLLSWFLGSFMRTRFENRRYSPYYIVVLWSALKLSTNLWIRTDNQSLLILGKQSLIVGILVLFIMWLYKADWELKLYLSLTFASVSEISFFLSYMIMLYGRKIFEFWVWCLEKGYITSMELGMTLVNGTAMLLQALVYAGVLLLSWWVCGALIREYREKEYRMSRRELLFILTPAAVGLLMCLLLRIIFVTMEGENMILLYDRYPLLQIVVPAILILSLLSIIFGVRLFQDMILLNREKSRGIVMERQVQSMQEHMKEMERIYAGIRGMRHDMKNTLSVIMQLEADAGGDPGGNRELQQYLEELNQTMDRLEFRFRTGNPVADTLLNMKYHEALNRVPGLEIRAEHLLFPEDLQIQGYDMAVILGNALDNAIEACERLRQREPEAEAKIRISSFCKGKMLFIEIENSFDGRVLQRAGGEFPETSKADREMHGIGLANIRDSAGKYQGAVDWEVHGRNFRLMVMMKNEVTR